MSEKKTAIIIGAGPAGLTAAYELVTRSDIRAIVLEKSTYMGGISRTVNYKGNRIDIGGHRFFSKSDRVMDWWAQHMPMESASPNGHQTISYQNQSRSVSAFATAPASGAAAATALAETPQASDRVMLLRARKSRIYFLRKFFDYPIKLSPETLRKLGFMRTMRIGFSYMRTVAFPPRRVENLEQFFISRFGRELYLTFFKSYTEKVWGVPCHEISAEWGEQRIKGLSIKKTLAHFFKQLFSGKPADVKQKNTETSLIEQFLYPKFGPGQMWEIVAEKIKQRGAEVHTEINVTGLRCSNGRICAVKVRDATGREREFAGDYFFSTMPVQELIRSLDCPVPEEVRAVSDGLQYRDFITVGILLKDLKIKDETPQGKKLVADNWIYIQEPDVFAGRLQVFNNWSPYLVAKPGTVWVGVEYFCYDTDPLWKLSDDKMKQLAIDELHKIGIIESSEVLDSTVLRMEKTYPAYFGTYGQFDRIREFVEGFPNLFLVGRNGMHKYNNQDHSMLTAMTAVDNILAGVTDKSNLWAVNTETEYHESKK